MEQKLVPIKIIGLDLKSCFEFIDRLSLAQKIVDSKGVNTKLKEKVYFECLQLYSDKDSSFDSYCNSFIDFLNYYSRVNLGALILLKHHLKEVAKNSNYTEILCEKDLTREELLKIENAPFETINRLNTRLVKNGKHIFQIEGFREIINDDNFEFIISESIVFMKESVFSQLKLSWFSLLEEVYNLEKCVELGIKYGELNKPELSKGLVYKNWDDGNTGFVAMENAFFDLQREKMISKDANYRDFSNFFRGKKPLKPIVWEGLKSDLSYFIKLLHSIFKVVEPNRKNIYNTIHYNFIKPDGSRFITSKFKNDKPTKNAKFLTKLVKSLATPQQIDSAYKNNLK